MENFLDFENSNFFKAVSMALSISNILFYFSHIYLINILYNNKNIIHKILTETSILNIVFELIFTTLFFGLLCKLYIKNTKFLNVSNLIGIMTSLEWFSIYAIFAFKDKRFVALLYFIIPLVIVLTISLIFFLIDDFDTNSESIIMNICFASYALMFVSPGINIYKLFRTGNPKYIMISNPILGLFSSISMIIFIIDLNHYNIMKFYYIIYAIVSLLICIFEIVFYIYKIYKEGYQNYNNFEEINPGFSDSNNDDDSNKKKISLVSRNSVEDDS